MPSIPKRPNQVGIHPDFIKFAKMELEACDFDAEHPIIIELTSGNGYSLEDKLWLCFLYMAFYDEASMWVVFNTTEPFHISESTYENVIRKLPIGKNRRNLYGANIVRHLRELCAKKNSVEGWPFHRHTTDPIENWIILKEEIGSIWGNGRFATFTTAELIQKVVGLDIEINGFDNKGSTGPADGISRAFYVDKKSVPALDKAGMQGYEIIKTLGLEPTYTDLDLGVMESIYCTFGATCRGKYYPGRNVDRQQGRILAVEELGFNMDQLWQARSEAIDQKFLGEFNTWSGIDKDRLKLYKDEGVLLWPYEKR